MRGSELEAPGHAGVLAHTVAVFAGGGAAWPANVTGIMGGMGFAAAGGLIAGPAWLGIVQNLPVLVGAAPRFTILDCRGPAGGHAVGVFRTGGAVYFFDSNQGEAYFATTAGFAAWFFQYRVPGLVPTIGATIAPAVSRMQFA